MWVPLFDSLPMENIRAAASECNLGQFALPDENLLINVYPLSGTESTPTNGN